MLVEASISGVGKDTFGAIGHPETGSFDHRQVIGAIADRQYGNIAKPKACLCFHKRGFLCVRIDDRTLCLTGQLLAPALQPVCAVIIETQIGRYRCYKIRETPGHEQGARAVSTHRPNQCRSSGAGSNSLGKALTESGNVEPAQEFNALGECSSEIQLTTHRPFGDGRHFGLETRIISQLIDALLPDHGGIHVRDEKLLPAKLLVLDDNIATAPALKGRPCAS